MLNYYYIYYNKIKNDVVSPEQHEKILAYIMNYHYPCCLSEFVEIKPEEEDRIMNDEFDLMKELVYKIDSDIEIIQIPRLIYDLFHSYGLMEELKIGINPKIYKFGYDYKSTSPTSSQYYNYCKIVWNMTINERNRDLLKIINDFAYYFIKERSKTLKIKTLKNITFIQWEIIMKSLIFYLTKEYTKIRENIVIDYLKVSKIIEKYLRENEINLVKLVAILDRAANQVLNNFLLQLENIMGTEFYKKHEIYIKIFLDMIIYHIQDDRIDNNKSNYERYLNVLFKIEYIRDQLIHDVNKSITNKIRRFKILIENEKEYLLNYTNYKLLKQVLLDEIGVYINKKNINRYSIMYRGLSTDEDSIVDRFSNESNPQSYSLSFNSSILNGHWSDTSACTYYYMINEPDTFKYRYLYERKINKHNRRIKFSDDLATEQLFFIPPLHPHIQLSSNGEFWHIRTLVGKDSSIININSFASIFNFEENLEYFPIFLRSSLDTYDLSSFYKNFISTNKVDIHEYIEGREFFNKYLKYKHKYVMLKNKVL
jgi:hypothetical protein